MRIRGALALSLVVALVTACAGETEQEAEPSEASVPEPGKDVPMIVISTSLGEITAELYPEESPVTVDNILGYVDDGFFDGTIFHRVIPGFMIQGGGFLPDMSQKATRPPITNEADNGLKNERGTLAMARTSDVNSATAQFFINLVDNDFLNNGVRDFGYAVFGRVVQGMEIADRIAAVPRQTVGRSRDVPVEAVIIESVRRVPPSADRE